MFRWLKHCQNNKWSNVILDDAFIFSEFSQRTTQFSGYKFVRIRMYYKCLLMNLMKCKKYCVFLRLRLPNMRWQCESMAEMPFGCGKLWFWQRISTQWTHICCNGMLALRNLYSVKLWKDPADFDGTQMNTPKWINFKWFNGTKQIRWLNESFWGVCLLALFVRLFISFFYVMLLYFFVALSLCSFIRFIFEFKVRRLCHQLWISCSRQPLILRFDHESITFILSDVDCIKKYLNYTQFSRDIAQLFSVCLFGIHSRSIKQIFPSYWWHKTNSKFEHHFVITRQIIRIIF